MTFIDISAHNIITYDYNRVIYVDPQQVTDNCIHYTNTQTLTKILVSVGHVFTKQQATYVCCLVQSDAIRNWMTDSTSYHWSTISFRINVYQSVNHSLRKLLFYQPTEQYMRINLIESHRKPNITHIYDCLPVFTCFSLRPSNMDGWELSHMWT